MSLSMAAAGEGPPGNQPAAPAPDADVLRLVRIGVVIRAVVALGVATSGSFLSGLDTGQQRMFLVLALVWLPWTLGLVLTIDRPDRRWVRIGAPVVDMAALGLAMGVMPEARPPLNALLVAVVAFALYTCPELPRWLPGSLGFVVAGTSLMGQADPLEWTARMTAFALVLALITVLRERMAAHERAARHAEAVLHSRADTILAHVPLPLVLTGTDGRIASWNDESTPILEPEVKPGDACADALDLHVGERRLDCSSGCALLEICAQTGDETVEVWRPAENGTRQPFLASVAAIRGTDGSVDEVIHAIRDITRLKQAEEAKTLFLATASHELKTPLTVIHGFAEMLLTLPVDNDEVKEEALQAILRRSSELSRIVDRLLLSSRIEAGRLAVAMAAVDVVGIVEERATALEAATGRPIVVLSDPEIPAVLADPLALATVVDHLLDNAIKYSPGEPPVTVEVCATPEAVTVAVTDLGVGMNAQQRMHCFDKFWQAESTDSRRYGGSGIGLYIVKSIVESLGANIDVVSQPGEGSTFTLRFGRADVTGGVPAQRASTDELDPEPSMIREFMRQLGVPTGGTE